MRNFFRPAQAPQWLGDVLSSIRAALSDIWPTPIRLGDYATTGLPPAADWSQGVAYDSTLSALKFSDGTNWRRVADYGASDVLKTTVFTVATLPAAATAGNGARAFVSDANATVFASIVAGGGANNVPVYSDGTNWRIG